MTRAAKNGRDWSHEFVDVALGWTAADPANPTPYFAVVERDFTPYAGFDILQAASQTPAIIGAGTHAWGNPAIVPATPAQWHISVYGTQIGIRGGTGTINVAIDNAPTTPITLTGGDDIIATRLSDSPHQITITDLPTGTPCATHLAPTAMALVVSRLTHHLDHRARLGVVARICTPHCNHVSQSLTSS
jgi:hypothetical protein